MSFNFMAASPSAVILDLGIYNLYVCIKQLILEKTSSGEIA